MVKTLLSSKMGNFHNLIITFLFGSFTVQLGSTDSGWSFKNQDDWPEKYCKGEHQSPISIDDDVKKIQLDRPVLSKGFYEKQEANVSNQFYAVLVTVSADIQVRHKSGDKDFNFGLFDLHWPSGHTINNTRYPLEGRFVFFNSEYVSNGSQFEHEDGVIVLSVFYDISPEDNPAFNSLVDAIPKIRKYEETTTIDIVLSDLFTQDDETYYLYSGSIPIPKCEEVVTYFVYPTVSSISKDQLEKLTSITDKDGDKIETNNRDLQPRNEREIIFRQKE